MILRKKIFTILSILLGIGCLHGCDKKEQSEWLTPELPQEEKTNNPVIKTDSLYFEQKKVTLDHTKQECAVSIRKNKIAHELYILKNVPWLHLCETRALDNHENRLQVDAHSGWTPRIAKLVIRNSKLQLTDTLTITQRPEKRFELPLVKHEAEADKEVFIQEIKHNTPLAASTPENIPWIKVSITAVSDSISQLQITVEKNTENKSRECEVIISAPETGLKQSVQVLQKVYQKTEEVTAMWVQGVHPPEKWDSLDVGNNIKIPVILETGNQGWFDNNKLGESYTIPFKNEERVISDRNHCWALVACNMIHWWVDQNRENIKRYEQATGKQVLNQITYDANLKGGGLNEKNRSSLAHRIRESCADKGYQTIDALKWFLSGRSLGRIQYPSSSAPGWFADVFPINSERESNLCDYYSIRKYENACQLIRRELETKRRILALTHTLTASVSHIITLYGAEFASDGKIIALYAADSDDQRHQIVKYGFTVDKDGNSRLVNPRTGKVMNKMPQHLYFLDNGQDAWSEFWNSNH